VADGRVSWISYAPVKGLRVAEVEVADVTLAGIPGDRRFHLINEQGHLVNAKRIGALLEVVASWDADGGRLALRFPDGSVVEDEVATNGHPVTTSFYGGPVTGALVAGPFADALTEFTGEPLRLVQPEEAGAGVDRGRVGAVTLLSQCALETLAGVTGVDAVDPRRFRMNFGVAGVEAHAEDAWLGRRVRLGEAVVVPEGHVGRCLITSREPETGRIDLDTLKALASYRGDLDTTEKVAFGVFGTVSQPGRVRVGDPVTLA
jgi:uncharacterized protein YcbX